MSRFIQLVKYHSAMFSDMTVISNLLKSQFRSLPEPADDFSGKTVIVTGANSGLGLEAAWHFVRLGAAKVILACRSLEKGEVARQDIESSTGRKGVVEVWTVDLTSFDSVKEFCRRAHRLERLDVVVLNAGVAVPEFVAADGGYESQIAVNVISTFLMALMLLPRLRETAVRFNVVPHVVLVSSDGHHFARFPERNQPNIFAAFKDATTMSDDRYNTSKLLVTMIARELATHLASSPSNPVVLNIVTPGFCKSQIFRNLPFPGKLGISAVLAVIGRTTEVGSRTLVSAAAAGRETHGKYLDSCVVTEPSAFVRSEEGMEVQSRVYAELMEVLEGIEPGVTRNILG
ncbi:short-chain dehydrogenase/reductase-like protein [Coniochaeta ligniaria NRRL 30616]|uniref:Short-chain dehydrogenase/reductase-like protein n=1 Tax=Coniochaeta ligniaria NRRL 30616 TaxID=1408157 RepID=A0A1J7IQ96_9PEZI|nr:short-chain dehydrogenase/reductase-like protein [Coniochaeta ligniaria NRRL 30616]